MNAWICGRCGWSNGPAALSCQNEDCNTEKSRNADKHWSIYVDLKPLFNLEQYPQVIRIPKCKWCYRDEPCGQTHVICETVSRTVC